MTYAATLSPSVGKGVPSGHLQKPADRRNPPCSFVQLEHERSKHRATRLTRIWHSTFGACSLPQFEAKAS